MLSLTESGRVRESWRVPDLRRYVPGSALAWPGDDVLAARGLHRQVDGTLVFVDVSGFTALSERLAQRGKVGAEQLTDVLNAVFGTMLGIASGRGGTLLKFGGDALFLLFTGPDHPVQAATAAVEMRSALAQTAKTSGPAGRLRLRMSVGVHSGRVDLFLVGDSHRDLVVVGPATTAVAEMEASASAGQILVSPATAALLPAGAVGLPTGPGSLLRWRRSRSQAPEDTDGRPTHAEVGAFVPLGLRALLSAADPESEHRTIGVSFIRYTGIDALLADKGHQAAADVLHTLVSAAQSCADAEGITFLATDLAEDGGKVILVAGFPTTAEDDQGRLLRATRRVVSRSVDEGWPIAVRAGLNRGHVFAGAIGSAQRATVTVMGDTVNLAARVMARAEPGTVLATPATLDNAQTLFATQPVEPFMVKGKARPVSAYVVGQEAGTRPPRGLGSLPFLGRDDQYATLTRAIAGLSDGTGGTVTVVGDAGMGKTRLLREALRTAGGLTVLAARAEPYGAATPYRPVRDPLRRLLGLSVAEKVGLEQTLVLTVSRTAPDLVPWLPLLGDVLGIPLDATSATRDLDPQFRPERTADAVVRLLEAAANGPLVVAFDDAHYSDDATAALAARFERETATRPWLLLAARREEDAGFRPLSGERVAVDPLDDQTARRLVLAGTEGAPLRPHEVDVVVRRVAGNPLFLEETLRNLREHGDIDALPASLEGMVAAQIDALPPLARRIVRRASVLGRSFRVSVLSDLLDDPGTVVDDATRKELADILEPDGVGRLRFRHALLRDAAYGSLPYQQRRHLHLLAARSTVRRAKDRPADYADNLALHYSMSGDAPNTWRWAHLAAEQARAAFANPEAAAQYQRALAAADRLSGVSEAEVSRTWESLGDVLIPMGRYSDAIRAFRSAAQAAPSDPVRRARLVAKRARAQERAQRFRGAYRDLSAASALARSAASTEGRQVEAEIAATRAFLLTFQDRFVEARRHARRAIALAQASGSDEAVALACVALETSLALMGLPADGSHLERALRIYQRTNNLERQSATLSNLGAIAYWAGSWSTARQRYDEAARIADRIGDVAGAAISRGNLAEILVNQGRTEEARPILEASLVTLRSTGLSADAGFVEVLLARCLTAIGDYDSAATTLRRLRELLLDAGQPDTAFAAAIALADNDVEAGRADAALATLDEAVSRSRESGSVLTPACQVVRAQALDTLGRPAEAADAAREGLAEATEQGLVLEQALLGAVLSRTDPGLTDLERSAGRAEASAQLRRLGVVHSRIEHIVGDVSATTVRDLDVGAASRDAHGLSVTINGGD